MIDLLVVGAGPVGLSAAFWAGMRELRVEVVEARPVLGGQLTALYPDKPIFDAPGHPRVLARDLVELHRRQAVDQLGVPVHTATLAERVTAHGDRVTLHTSAGDLEARALLVAAGHGAFVPRRPAGVDVARWLGRGVHEGEADRAAVAGRRVLVAGGGEDALRRVRDLVGVAASVGLVHRRSGFLADPATEREVRRAAADGHVRFHLPRVVTALHGGGRLERVTLTDPRYGDVTEDVGADTLVLELGLTARVLPLLGDGPVGPTGATALPRVWACGDAATPDDRPRLLATGYAQAATAVAHVALALRPGTRLQPRWSTLTGVPGAAGGNH